MDQKIAINSGPESKSCQKCQNFVNKSYQEVGTLPIRIANKLVITVDRSLPVKVDTQYSFSSRISTELLEIHGNLYEIR